MSEVPQNLDAEMAVLGCLLIDPDCTDDVRGVLPAAEAFYTPQHAELYQAVLDFHETGDPMDLIAFEAWLKRNGRLERVGDREYLIQLSESFSDPTNHAHYARLVRDAYLRRQCIQAAELFRAAAYDPLGPDPAELCADHAQHVETIAGGAGADAVVDVRDTILGLPDAWDRRGNETLTTGLQGFDRHAGGIERPSVVLIAARPSTGKTSLALAVAIHAAQSRVPTLFVSIETTARKIGERIVTMTGAKSAGVLRHREGPDNRVFHVRQVADTIPARMLRVTDSVRGIREIVALCRASARRDGTRLIIIDHIQLIRPDGRYESRNLELAAIADALHHLSKATAACVVALSQFNRQGQDDPTLRALRDSGALEEVADVVLLLHRTDSYSLDNQTGIVQLIVAKNRDGPTFIQDYDFDKRRMTFTWKPKTEDKPQEVGTQNGGDGRGTSGPEDNHRPPPAPSPQATLDLTYPPYRGDDNPF